MRNLIILKGPERCGKSALIDRLGLSQWHIDSTAVSRLYATPTLDEAGAMSLRPQSLRRANDHLVSAVRAKFEQSDFIVLELNSSPNLRSPEDSRSLLRDLITHAEKYLYKVTLVDFDAASEEIALSGLHSLSAGRKPRLKALSPARFEALIDRYKNPITDISHVDAIVAVGDVHANANALEACLSQAEGRGRFAFLFTGDFLNKGPDPVRTIELLTEFKQRNSDCFMLCGNHEIMLENWAWRRGTNRDVFLTDTLPHLQAERFSRKDARRFLERLHDHVRLHWRGFDILATHGGLSTATDAPGFLSGHTKRLGVGHAGTDIDRLWERNCTDQYSLQIHGHRNTQGISVEQSTRSFNLEGIDAFGCVSGMVLKPHEEGFRAQGFTLPICSSTRRSKKGGGR
jgi:predicted kinase